MMLDYKRKNHGLSPRKIILVYLIAFCLVSLHESGRITSWAERLSLDWAIYPQIQQVSKAVNSFANRLGIPEVVAAEDRLLDTAKGLPEIGRVEPETASAVNNRIQAAVRYPDDKTIGTPAVSPEKTEPESRANASPEPDLKPVPPVVNDASPKTEEKPRCPLLAPEKPNQSENGGSLPEKELPVENNNVPAPQTDGAASLEPKAAGQPAKEAGPVRKRPTSILLAGDSMMLEGFGPAVQRILEKRPGLKVYREGKYSSGLSRPDYFDWMSYLEELLDKHKPDLLVVCLGANDAQDILDENKKRHIVGTDSWNSIYRARADRFLEIARSKNVDTLWVGLPIMGLAKYSDRIENLNAIQEAACNAHDGCQYIDTWLVLADDKNAYTTFLKDEQGRHVRIRSKDKIHLTETGGGIVANYFLQTSSAFVEFPDEEGKYRDGESYVLSDPPASGGTEDAVSGDAEVRLMELPSAFRRKLTKYYAFIPKGSAGRTYPVLYLLHGAWDGYDAWKKHDGDGLLKLAARYQLIIVTPDGEPFGWYADSPIDETSQIESYIIKELLPDVENRLPAIPEKRSIAGLSMGGHGAFILALRHPGTFLSVSSMSGVMDITAHSGQWNLSKVFGKMSPENLNEWKDHSAVQLAGRHADYLKTLPALVTVSAGDPWVLQDNRAFNKEMKALGVKLDYRESDGTHDWRYWMQQLPEHVAFHAAALGISKPPASQ